MKNNYTILLLANLGDITKEELEILDQAIEKHIKPDKVIIPSINGKTIPALKWIAYWSQHWTDDGILTHIALGESQSSFYTSLTQEGAWQNEKEKMSRKAKCPIDDTSTGENYIRNLINDYQNIGFYRALWSGDTANGKSVASGIYICKINFNNAYHTMRLQLLK